MQVYGINIVYISVHLTEQDTSYVIRSIQKNQETFNLLNSIIKTYQIHLYCRKMMVNLLPANVPTWEQM